MISKLPSLKISEATDGKETMMILSGETPDLILMDISLPGENGIILTGKIKKKYPDICIAINTNYDSFEYRDAAIEVGADYFLSKKSNSINDLIQIAISIKANKLDTRV
jgi:YesN/AraC family two-component response regulator